VAPTATRRRFLKSCQEALWDAFELIEGVSGIIGSVEFAKYTWEARNQKRDCEFGKITKNVYFKIKI
jgi:hypothetical protein